MRINDGAKEHKLQNSPDNIQVQPGTGTAWNYEFRPDGENVKGCAASNAVRDTRPDNPTTQVSHSQRHNIPRNKNI